MLEAASLTAAFGLAGERWHGGMSAMAQGAESVLLQAADESRPLSLLLPGVPGHGARGGAHVSHRCSVVLKLKR